VKTIAIGGLPGGKPMQAIGGTKGDDACTPVIVQNDVQMLVELDAIADMDEAKSTLPGLIPFPLGSFAGTLQREYGINTRNHLLPNDTIPSMMRFEPADCHIYYTPENVGDVEKMWHDAVDIAWNNKACVSGTISTGNATGTNAAPGTTPTGHHTSGSIKDKVLDKTAALVIIVATTILKGF
jgi:hypothetical protein